MVAHLSEGPVPQLYWSGYDRPVLISANFIAKWSVTVCNDPLTRVFPRRWLDIRGAKVADYWQAALRAVMGLVIFRPGITQVGLNGLDATSMTIVHCSLPTGGDLLETEGSI